MTAGGQWESRAVRSVTLLSRGGPDPGPSGFPYSVPGSGKTTLLGSVGSARGFLQTPSPKELSRPDTVLSRGWWELKAEALGVLVPLGGSAGGLLQPPPGDQPPETELRSLIAMTGMCSSPLLVCLASSLSSGESAGDPSHPRCSAQSLVSGPAAGRSQEEATAPATAAVAS